MASEKKVKLDISGMHCAACSSRIERVVGNLSGVESAEVNLANETAEIVHNEDECSFEDIQKSIGKLGFGAKVSVDPLYEFENKKKAAREQLQRSKSKLVNIFLFAIPLFILSMGEMVGIKLPMFLSPNHSPVTFAAVQLLLVIPIIWLGRNFYIIGLPALWRKSPNMDSLIAVGTGAAFIYSLWNSVEIFLGIDVHSKTMDLYFESTGVLIALVSLGKYLEMRSKSKMSDAISKLIKLTPDSALVFKGEEVCEISVEDLSIGDVVLIKPGERIPVDGIVVKGESVVDESMLTGESMPVKKCIGDTMYGGTLNSSGSLHLEANQVGQDTMLAKIVRLVQQAQGSKAPIANLADKISYYFVPTVMVFALIVGCGWYFVGDVGFSGSLRFFIAVMVIACPCAMGLATPTSIMVGTGRGAQLGILVKNGEALERAEKIDVIAFDKTGTLTHGKPKLVDIINLSQIYSDDELLSLTGSAEQLSEHPLAAAIMAEVEKRGLELIEPETFNAVVGHGVNALVAKKNILFGNLEFLQDNNVNVNLKDDIHKKLSITGKTVLYLAVDNILSGVLAVADTLKEEVPQAIKELSKMDIHSVMLTGDHELTAHAIAREAGIGKVIARILPEEKAQKVQRLQGNNHIVAMVGDGINDAPALAVADVGIAMGTGIDVAIESGDIVVMKGSLKEVVAAIKLSKAVMKNIKQNLFWAFAYNVVGIPIAAGVLVIFGGPALNPMLAGAAMALSSISVVTNALRLRYFKP